MSLPTSWQMSWGPRAMGLAVLVLAAVASIGLAVSGGAPTVTWIVLVALGVAAAVATLANFGDRYHVDEDGIRYENVITSRFGWRRARFAPWADISRAVELDSRTWFLHVEGQGRWVLDQLDGHEMLRLLLEARGISVKVTTRPSVFGRAPVDRS